VKRRRLEFFKSRDSLTSYEDQTDRNPCVREEKEINRRQEVEKRSALGSRVE